MSVCNVKNSAEACRGQSTSDGQS